MVEDCGERHNGMPRRQIEGRFTSFPSIATVFEFPSTDTETFPTWARLRASVSRYPAGATQRRLSRSARPEHWPFGIRVLSVCEIRAARASSDSMLLTECLVVRAAWLRRNELKPADDSATRRSDAHSESAYSDQQIKRNRRGVKA